MSKHLFLIDAGHGGVDVSGHYTTAPAKMHKFPDGMTVLEGVINRKIASKLMRKLRTEDIDYVQIHDDILDLSLIARVSKADAIFRSDRRCVYLSIHSNAGGGKGNEVFTSPGQNRSDKLAQIFAENYVKMLPQFPLRKDVADGDWDKEADFYVLRKTDCPALLVENLFFDNRSEADYLMSDAGQEAIAEVLFQSAKQCEEI
jgi:N-acetylmuramoyl-L-alanine amidase